MSPMPMGPSTCQCVPNKNHLGALKENKKSRLSDSVCKGAWKQAFLFIIFNQAALPPPSLSTGTTVLHDPARRSEPVSSSPRDSPMSSRTVIPQVKPSPPLRSPRSPDLGIFCPLFTSESCQFFFFFLPCVISFPGWALTTRLPAGPRNSQQPPALLAPSLAPRLGLLSSQPCLFRRSRCFLRLEGPLSSPGPSQCSGNSYTARAPPLPATLASHHASSGMKPGLGARHGASVLPAAAPAPSPLASPPATWLRSGRSGSPRHFPE